MGACAAHPRLQLAKRALDSEVIHGKTHWHAPSRAAAVSLHSTPIGDYDATIDVASFNDWYPKLTKDPAFMNRVKARWAELRQGLLSDSAVEQRISKLTAPLASAAVRDYAKWHVAEILKPGAFVRGPSATTGTVRYRPCATSSVRAVLGWIANCAEPSRTARPPTVGSCMPTT